MRVSHTRAAGPRSCPAASDTRALQDAGDVKPRMDGQNEQHREGHQTSKPEAAGGVHFEALEDSPGDWLRAVGRGLDECNRGYVGDYTSSRMGVFAFASPERETLIGGVFGELQWDWLYIQSLWVHPDYRGAGTGAVSTTR
jgi:GNAT superfamily N-acetyltransferase